MTGQVVPNTDNAICLRKVWNRLFGLFSLGVNAVTSRHTLIET